MSTKVMGWVFEISPATGNDRLVLLAIADEADDNGSNAFPSMGLIGKKARVNERTTRRCIERLEELGELFVLRPEKRGRGHFNRYVVLMGRPVEEGQSVLLSRESTPSPPTPKKGAERGGKGRSPSQNAVDALTHVPADAEKELRGRRFTRFWEGFPRRNGKRLGEREAEHVWNRMEPADHEAAWIGEKHYAVACEAGLTIAKDAHRWLRGRCWEEWQEPAVADQRHRVNGAGPRPKDEQTHATIREMRAERGIREPLL